MIPHGADDATEKPLHRYRRRRRRVPFSKSDIRGRCEQTIKKRGLRCRESRIKRATRRRQGGGGEREECEEGAVRGE